MENTQEMTSYRQPIFWLRALTILCVTAVVVVSVALALRKDDFNNQFSVSATGRVFAKPDIANLIVGVKTEAKSTAALAVKEKEEKHQLIKTLYNKHLYISQLF